MMTCSRRYFSAIGVRLVAGVDDRPLQRRLEADLDLEEVGPLGDLEAAAAAVLADADPAGAGDDLAGDEERREVAHDVGERRLAPHQVVLVGAVGGALVVGVVLVQVDRRGARHHRGPAAASAMIRSPALSQRAASRGLVHLGRGVLRVRVVDVEPGAVGEDDVGQADVLVGQLAGVGQRRARGRSRGRRAAGSPPRSPSAGAGAAPATAARRR